MNPPVQGLSGLAPASRVYELVSLTLDRLKA
jgi:hypothetical protein